MNKIDLHFHSVNSDGAFSTSALLNMAEEKNLKIISITDHDSVQAYFDIKENNLTFNGKIIPGVELSFNKDGSLYDVLGYGIDINFMNDWLKHTYSTQALIENQTRILEEMQALYKSLNIKIANNLSISTGKKAEAYNLIKQSALTFEENKTSAPELFEEMFYKRYHTNKKSKFFIDETLNLPTLEECIEIIHKAGGVASLAHPGAYGFSKPEMEEFIKFAISKGVDAVELKYNCHTPEQEQIIEDLAQKNGLLLTGGSDFHGGKIKPQVSLGKVYDNNDIYASDFEDFFEKVTIFQDYSNTTSSLN